jgi:uncharacterized protein
LPTKNCHRLVADTNSLLSHMLIRNSVADRAVVPAIARERVLLSEATFAELAGIFIRPKFDRYLPIEQRRQLLAALGSAAEWIRIAQPIRACRDPRDDKFLEVAADGEADAILTRNAGLLALDPFRGIAILTPADWLHRPSPLSSS